MFTTQFWLIVIGIAQMIGCSWIFSKFQKRAYKREIRSRHSYVLLAKLLAEEEKLRCNISKCNEDGTGEVYLGLPEGIVKVFSLGNGRFAIFLVGAVIINDLHVDMAREICKDLNTKESRVRYSVGFEPAFSKTGISITCDFEEDGDDETYNNITPLGRKYLQEVLIGLNKGKGIQASYAPKKVDIAGVYGNYQGKELENGEHELAEMSFVGVFPRKKPRYALAVIINRPNEQTRGPKDLANGIVNNLVEWLSKH